jgi:putative ABC transport system substrate-binding protein
MHAQMRRSARARGARASLGSAGKWLAVSVLVSSWLANETTVAAAANIAVILSADVEEYRKALEGFKSALNHRIVAEYDMEGDLKRGKKIVEAIGDKGKPDLIFAVGLWALQVAVSRSTDLPVVYAMVLNPPSVVGPAPKNITGASMNIPVEQPIRLFKQLGPQIRRIGVIFNGARTGYLVRRAAAIAREQGLQLIDREIQTPREAIPALESLTDSIDALWIVPDETVLAPTIVQQMLLFSYRKKIPLLGLSENQAQMGALASLSFASGEDIGRQAAELANSILAGKAAAEVPYTTARQVKLTVNLKAAQKLGMEIPKSILDKATTVIQ